MLFCFVKIFLFFDSSIYVYNLFEHLLLPHCPLLLPFHSYWPSSSNKSPLYFNIFSGGMVRCDPFSLVRAACMSMGEGFFTGAWAITSVFTTEETPTSPAIINCQQLLRRGWFLWIPFLFFDGMLVGQDSSGAGNHNCYDFMSECSSMSCQKDPVSQHSSPFSLLTLFL